MSKTKRIIALALVIVTIFSLLAVTTSAKSYSGKNKCFIVDTGKAPWYTHAKIKITNTGNTKMTINVEKSNGSLFKTVSALKPGKSTTISLRDNQTFYVYWAGNAMSGSINATGRLESVQYIKSIY